MSGRPRASIIVPAFNVEAYLSRCLESLLRQTETSVEVIVVDDGSTDATRRVADGFARRDPRVRVLGRENGGLSAARNTGLDEATGEYVVFVDADDWVEPRMVETLTAACERSGAAISLGGVVVDFHDENDVLVRSQRFAPPGADLDRFTPHNIDLTSHHLVNLLGYAWNKAYRRDWLEHRGARFEEGLSLVEDIVFNAPLLGAAERLTLVPEVLVHYVQRPRDTLGSARDENFPARRLRAVQSVDAVLAAWGVGDEPRRRRVAHSSGHALWAALRSAASSETPASRVRLLASSHATRELIAHARGSGADWRGRWAAATLARRWYRIALLPTRILTLRTTSPSTRTAPRAESRGAES